MGLSTDALVWYGYCWGEEGESLFDTGEDGDREWEEVWLEKRGMTRGEREFDEWYEIRKKALTEAGAMVASHCSIDYPMPLVAVTGTLVRALRGRPKGIDLPPARPEWDAQLEEFCRVMGIAPPDGQKPQWWLASDMG